MAIRIPTGTKERVGGGMPEATGWDVTYEGTVLETRERNYRDDSDFYAIVWDEAEGKVKSIEYATTRGWTYLNSATVDATPEVIAKAEAWLAERMVEGYRRADEARAGTPEKGKRVKVVAGRKIPKGTEGEVFWYGAGRVYGYRYRVPAYVRAPMRVGIRFDDGTKEFTDAKNVEVIDAEAYRTPDAVLVEKAKANAKGHNWAHEFLPPGMVMM